MDVLLIRHGHSLMNDHERRQWISQKTYDRLLRRSPTEPLTCTGKSEVRDLAKRLRGESVRILYTSPWRRTRQTATILGHAWHLRPRVLRDAHEVSPVPLPNNDAHAPFWWLMLRSYARMLLPQSGPESWWVALGRARRLWREVQQKPAPLIAVVAHGRIITLLLCIAHLLPGMRVQRQRMHKAGVSRVTIS